MLALKLAIRNLIGAGIRTWLNVIVLSFSFVLIIWTQGFYSGIYDQAELGIKKEIANGGQYWHPQYDPFDPFTLIDSHGPIPNELNSLIQTNQAAAILLRQAAIYPEGRIKSVLMKGIDPSQKILDFPTYALNDPTVDFPILVGRILAANNHLKKGDMLTIRWRDANGSFDAIDGTIVKVMNTESPNIDKGQIWVPLNQMQELTEMQGEASIVAIDAQVTNPPQTSWDFKDIDYFLKDVREFVTMKSIGAGVMYAILLFLAMLGIFDTQVLSIFRRRKEIGTMIALGLTRGRVISIFTIEGAMHGVLAGLVGFLYGAPLLWISASQGFPMAELQRDALSFGMPERLFPTYGLVLIVGTTVLVMGAVTIVSFLPTREIAKLDPTEAIRGKTS